MSSTVNKSINSLGIYGEDDSLSRYKRIDIISEASHLIYKEQSRMLSQIQQMREDREKGFTIIELLVVIVIIGILAAITVPAFMNQRTQAVDSSVKSDVSNAANVVETWIIKNPSKVIPTGTVVYSDSGEPAISPSLSSSGMIKFKASEGTTLTITGSTTARGTFTIKGENDKGDKSLPANGIFFDSTKGGLQ